MTDFLALLLATGWMVALVRRQVRRGGCYGRPTADPRLGRLADRSPLPRPEVRRLLAMGIRSDAELRAYLSGVDLLSNRGK